MIIRRRALPILALVACLLGGCEGGYFFTPLPETHTRTVEPEYAGMPGRTVVVIVWVPESTEFSDADLRADLARYIQRDITEGLEAALKKGKANVTFVPQVKVQQFQLENLHWTTTPVPDLGRKLGADMVLSVVVDSYTLTQPGHMLYHRGRISSDCMLYDLKQPRGQEKVWSKPALAAQYPPEQQTGSAPTDASLTRRALLTVYASELGRCFYKHKEIIDE